MLGELYLLFIIETNCYSKLVKVKDNKFDFVSIGAPKAKTGKHFPFKILPFCLKQQQQKKSTIGFFVEGLDTIFHRTCEKHEFFK